MNTEQLQKWTNLLLETTKRNNLVNFKDSKTGTVEVLLPTYDLLFQKIEYSAEFKVYDPLLDINNVEDESTASTDDHIEDETTAEPGDVIPKEEYIEKYKNCLKKNQILIYNSSKNPNAALRNIRKKAKLSIEETGVNTAYIAFGFINWTESENSQYVMKAPILLAPISIEHNSAIEPFTIKITDADIVPNPTFSNKLETEYGFKLPDYNEESIDDYLEKIKSIISVLKWTITNECKISIFSFSKINMLKDLTDNTSLLAKNPIIRSLLGETNVSLTDTEDTSKDTLNNPLVQLHNVIDADSSQIEAIELARSGKSFVLQGPPGTGKSQTITNIIAECLALNKKVLFVAEKLAALNVVYNKLHEANLSQFCLELHSHKANKRDVIKSLCNELKSEKTSLNDLAQQEIEALVKAQKKLDTYTIELHKIRPVINKTLYNMLNEVATYRNSPSLEYIISKITTKGDEYIKKAEDLLNSYVQYTSSIGVDYHNNYWYGYNSDSSYQTKINLKQDLRDSLTLCENIKELDFLTNNSFNIRIQNINQAYTLKRFFEIAKDSNFITPYLLDSSLLKNIQENAEKISNVAKMLIENKSALDSMFDQDIYKIDGNLYYKKLTKQFNSFFSRLFSSEYKQIINDIKLCTNSNKKVKYKNAVEAMTILSNYQQYIVEFNRLKEQIKESIATELDYASTDFKELFEQLNCISHAHSLNVDFASLKELTIQDYLSKQNEFESISNKFSQAFSQLEEAESRVANKYNLKECDVRNLPLESLIKKYQECIDNIDELDNWCNFIKLLENLNNLELKTFVDYTINHNIKPSEILGAFKKAFYSQWTDAIIQNTDVLNDLSRVYHDNAIADFKEKDRLLFEINKSKVKSTLYANRPNLEMIAPGSAISILLREGEKQRKQKPIRTLLKETGTLVQTLKPCFLMSPLSVSTFLDPKMNFDVVIFDEASQIFPQDSLGAIYRAKQLIVVGDSKQMPPTSFFNASISQNDNDETEDITDYESILDICSTFLPYKRLKWHYRSRYESLISFSNRNFYDNELITFPSSKFDTEGIGVDYFYVNGIFDRSTKTNRIEAEKIVDLVFKNIEQHPERSLGVVAFSISQQNLIDNLIAKRRQKDPSKENFFNTKDKEPFFVKNLETVQGDERDTIIFSVAYGKDSQGRSLLNFGPLNRAGGERRLNVAVTRAKHNIQIVSSMHHYDIDLSRAQSNGARLLRAYLDYAENGNIALERSISVNAFEKFDSEFEMEVCDFLRANGYDIDTQVGCSSFRIDLALKHPNSSNYLLAIECDGASYHSSKSARDRDRLRQEILENMGWNFYRIWSTDWFRNKSIEKEKLLNAVKEATSFTPVNSKKKDLNPEIRSFDDKTTTVPFEFPKYDITNDKILALNCKNNPASFIYNLVLRESPLSEEWLLKRIAFLFDRKKVTSVVRENYEISLKACFKHGIVRKNGFLYCENKEIEMLRVPKENASQKREIQYIHLEELALGMKQIIKHNISVQKDGLFRLLAEYLGFNRVGDNINEHLEKALLLLSNEISIDENIITLKDFN